MLGSPVLSVFFEPCIRKEQGHERPFSAQCCALRRSRSRKPSKSRNRILRSEPLESRMLLSSNGWSLLASYAAPSAAAIVRTVAPVNAAPTVAQAICINNNAPDHQPDRFALGSGKGRRGRTESRLHLVGLGRARRRHGDLQYQRQQCGEECDGHVHQGRHLQLDGQDH